MYDDNLTDDQIRLIDRHLELVAEKNKVVNLTRIETIEEARVLHVLDSLTALEELNECPEGKYGDLGSGAGFPGIPLSVVSGRQTVLIDARKKKMDAVNDIIEELSLSHQIRTFAGRAELLAIKEPKSFAVLTARALSKLSVLMELASPLLVKGGRLICYKSHVDEDEYAHAKEMKERLGMKLVSDRSFILEETYLRRIIVFEKIHEAKMKLPRQEGQAQKNPL